MPTLAPSPDALRHRPAILRPRRALAGLRVLLTGGSSGVGRALAVELSARGAAVFATARRAPLLATLAAEHPIAVLAGDVTDNAFRHQLVAAAVKTLGGLDVVIAAAGSGAIGRFAEADPATLRRVMEIDFFAPAELVRLTLPSLALGSDPAVVLVGSILGLHPIPLHADYCAAKAAVHSLAGTLRAELAPVGIDVLLATLGPTASEFWDSLLAGDRPVWSRGRQLDAATTARVIIAALERRRTTVYPGFSAKGFALAARFCPRLIDRIIRRRMAEG
jgi:short-subunit dehydrogenase